MNIQTAVALALETGKFITRENAWWSGYMKIQPTNTPACCIAFSVYGDNKPRWQPHAEDLIATDWKLTE